MTDKDKNRNNGTVKDSEKMYVLGMFPYPSGAGLHVGHVRIYTACDVMSRYFKFRGYDVLHPMGWDAFGLPAENAAIKFKTNPMKMVPINEANFRKQLDNLSMSFDWSREFSTTNPDYYGLTQWLFLKLYEKGLVYRDMVPINWCPKCKTGIANEEVLSDGTHERCGEGVERRKMWQWVMKITDYADRLLETVEDALDGSDVLDWPRGALEMQKNWIGRDKGLSIKFKIEGSDSVSSDLVVWTKHWETVFGVTFLVVAPEVAKGWMESGWDASDEVHRYVEESLRKTERARMQGEKDKSGVDTGLVAVNPVNGDRVPVYVADYVLASVGTGAVMGVPAHDDRDFEFAKKYDLPIVQVVKYEDEEVDKKVRKGEMSFEGDGELINSGKFDGMSAWGDGKQEMAKWMIDEGFGEWKVNYHLRDWVFSRQRYWGEPIPLVKCEKCGVVPLSEKDLPLELPYLESYEPTDTGESPLSRVEDWVKVKCPKCGGDAERETDTMPNWAGSCWYFLAFPFWNENIGSVLREYKEKYPEQPYTKFWNEVVRPAVDRWMPVDWYLGGAEHAVLHLLYARFWVKVFYDMDLLGFDEPFKKLRFVGIVLAEDGRKMSKSWGNVVNPDDMIKEYGSDAVRMYEMFMGPWDQSIAWDTRSLVGQKRFLERLRELVMRDSADKSDERLQSRLYRLLHRFEYGIVNQKFNVLIAGMMEFTNEWRDGGALSDDDIKKFLIALSLFAPKLAGELWKERGYEGAVSEQEWPVVEVDDEDVVEMVIQVNGKRRASIEVDSEIANDRDRMVEMAMADDRVKKFIHDEPKRVVFVEGRVVNIVV